MKPTAFIYIVAILLVFSSCRKERNMAYEGPTMVEFNNPISGVNTKLTGQSIGGASNIGGDINIPIRGEADSVIVQLVGLQRAEPINISYEVVPGTAVEGTHFDIIGEKGSLTIAPNSSVGIIRFSLKNFSATPSDIRTFSLRLLSTDKADVAISANYASYAVSIFPMRANLDKTLSGSTPAYFSSATGEVYPTATGNPGLADIAFTNSPAPSLISPALLSNEDGASETFFSKQVFVPAATVPSHLLYSYATLQLNAVTSAMVNSIPVTGTTAAAAVFEQMEVVKDGIYGFVNGAGKNGYIRIKNIDASGNISFDVMAQP